MKPKYTLPPLLVSEYSRRLEMLTTVSRVTTLGFLSWSQVLLDTRWPTIRRRGIGACPWTFLNSSTTSHSAFSPVWPIRVSARYRWEEIVKKRKRIACYWLIVNCRLMLQTVILTTIVWVSWVSSAGPRFCSTQVGPPPEGGGLVQVLERFWTPPPHVTLHSAHLDQLM